jgi:hypothetical protein
MLSRRRFLGQWSAASVFTAGRRLFSRTSLGLIDSKSNLSSSEFVERQWQPYGRIALKVLGDSVTINDGYLAHQTRHGNCEFSFQARMPAGSDEVQIWAGIRCKDRDSRYVFALRGGNNDHLYLARYAPGGASKFLGIAPLEFHPEPGTWYTLRAVAADDRLQLYLNEETVPRINIRDEDALWNDGSVVLGGGWLPVEFRHVRVEALSALRSAAVVRLGDTVWTPPAKNKIKLRAEQRAAYQSVSLPALDSPRIEFSLDGKWLFLPEQELATGVSAQAEMLDDSEWHVMDVPNFWTPTATWLHGETGFDALTGVSAGKGISDRYSEYEMQRLDGYTFDWRHTRSAWYRQHIELPSGVNGRHFELCFDAIAKLCEVWVNGTSVGSHVGMFGEVRCDVTKELRSGNNVIAVHVVGMLQSHTSSQVMGVAVTVEVTSSMLNSLPHGMYREESAGIWQPVRLIVTRDTFIQEIVTSPRTDGLDFEVSLRNTSAIPKETFLRYSIRSTSGGEDLYLAGPTAPRSIGSGNTTIALATPKLAPKLWSPQEPNLYRLDVSLHAGDDVLDRQVLSIGFRTFSVEKETLLLNGKPFLLRGANHFPHALRPNDAKLAQRFMKLAKEGNVVATRSHTAPFTSTWLKAADENGMLLSYEGTWPWLMLKGDPPSNELLGQWKEEFLSLIRKHRNHPSIVMWTVNNEMKFPLLDRGQPKLLQQKWEILSDVVKAIRHIDPTRPIVCDSSYTRKETGKEYEDLVRPKGFDDGDIDDAHCYFGWYEPTFFHFFRGEFGNRFSTPGRPLISQEMSTGYPRNDDGHPTRFYLFKHYTPQSLVGDEAYENRDPSIFLRRQALITKEFAEAIRRTNRSQCAGILHFAYLSWFKDVWNVDSIQPFVTYHALKAALQPVLVSAELYGRHFYAGSTRQVRVCIANDAMDGAGLPAGRLVWHLRNDQDIHATGTALTPPVAHYDNAWIDLPIPIPADSATRRMDTTLSLRYEIDGAIRSENTYEVMIATPTWAVSGLRRSVALLDLAGIDSILRRISNVKPIQSFADTNLKDLIVVADAIHALSDPRDITAFRSFIENGGRALLLGTGTQLPKVFPEFIEGFRPCPGEIVSMRVPESPVFDGLDPLDLVWFELGNGSIPRACHGTYSIRRNREEVSALAEVVDIHGYLRTSTDFIKISGSPLVELRVGKGRVVASEMMLLEAPLDPIAGRLLSNLITYLNPPTA